MAGIIESGKLMVHGLPKASVVMAHHGHPTAPGRGRGPVPPVVPPPAPGPTLVAGPLPIPTPADWMLG